MPVSISTLGPEKRATYRDAVRELLRAGLIPSIPKELEPSPIMDIMTAPAHENILWQLPNGRTCCAIYTRLVSLRGGVILKDFAISSDWVADFTPLSAEGRKSYRLRHGFDFSFGEVLNHRIEGGLRFHRRGDLAEGWLLAEGGTIPSQYPNRITAPLNVTLIDQFGDSHCARAEALVERMPPPKKNPGSPPKKSPGSVEPQTPEQYPNSLDS